MRFLPLIFAFAWAFGGSYAFAGTSGASKTRTCDSALLTNGYAVEISDVTEEVNGNPIQFKRLDPSAPSALAPIDRLNWKGLKRNTFSELFSKLVLPSAIHRWDAKSFKLSELISNNDREIVWGLEVNHWYVAFKGDGPESEWTRVDYIVSKGSFFIRKGADKIAEGLFFRVPDVSDEDIQTLSNFFSTQDKFLTCAEASCTALAQVGIHVGQDGIPATTEDVFKRLLAEGFRRDGVVPDRVEVVSTSESPLQKQVDDAVLTSRMLTGMRNGKIRAFIGMFHYGAKTVLRWTLLWAK